MSQLGCCQFGVEVYAQGLHCQSGPVVQVVSRMWKFHWAAGSRGHLTLGCSPYKYIKGQNLIVRQVGTRMDRPMIQL